MSSTAFHTVVCTDLNDYVNWQVELLEYSWSRIQQAGDLIRLVACEDDQALPTHRHARVFRTQPSNVHPDSGDVYVCYNRLYSLQQWLEEYPIQGNILIVDSDVVFKAPVTMRAQPGQPIAQPWLDFGISAEFKDAILQHSAETDIDSLQKVTWPAIFDADDLRRLLPDWIAATVAIREAIKRQESDMFGLLVAAQVNDITFETATTTAFMPWPDSQVAGAPLIHYCQVVKDNDDQQIWSKFQYQPWQRVDLSRIPQLAYCGDLLSIVDEFARIKDFAHSHESKTIFIAIAAYCEPELIDTIESCLSKARHPENLRFGLCHQYDESNELTSRACLDRYAQDLRFKYVRYPYEESQGGCWARNLAQQLYDGETYTLQIDAHTQMIESWDTLLIEMLESMPSAKPLVTQFPPLYSINDGLKHFYHIEDLQQVNVGIAKEWAEDGHLLHTQVLKPEFNQYPRYGRLLSGAFVFTTGEWNHVVRQDPEHFYTGEEFALALRSYTHGYDLFDPNQIVCWHRLHPHANRKFWDDNESDVSVEKHYAALLRLKLLTDGDPDKELGDFGLGEVRTLADYTEHTGIDCKLKEISADAQEGRPPIFEQPLAKVDDIGPAVLSDQLIDISLQIKDRDPLLLSCAEHTPVLMDIILALQNKLERPDDLIYLNLSADGSEQIYLRASQLLAIETSPPLSEQFFEQMALRQQVDQDVSKPQAEQAETADLNQVGTVLQGGEVPDDWKIWIWKSVERGASKDSIFKELIERGFAYHVAKIELNHEPTQSLDLIKSVSAAADQSVYVANPVATRLDTQLLEIYEVDDFLNNDECERAMSLLQQNLQRSTVVVGDDNEISEHRTSSSGFFDLQLPANQLLLDISNRIAKFIGVNPNRAEAIQGQFYRPGEEYKAHMDWFGPEEIAAQQGLGGQRTWSVLVYLNHVAAGGETKFNEAGITIEPTPGKLVYWNNADAQGDMNSNTNHQACPVLEGEKAILTVWFRTYGAGPLYQRELSDSIPQFTRAGIKKMPMPKKLFSKLRHFYRKERLGSTKNEFVPGEFLANAGAEAPSKKIELTEELRTLCHQSLLAICEEWSEQSLGVTAVYGIRDYVRDTTLKSHTDTQTTHIISAILNVDQQVDEPWPLQIEDHMCRLNEVFLEPGEMLLYEGARLAHGRTAPLKGESFANIFVHFCPSGYERAERVD
ncbi:MAG: GlcNAc-transferase family protein [Pseudomonadota bacterium]